MKKSPLFLFSLLALHYLCCANRCDAVCAIYIKAFT